MAEALEEQLQAFLRQYRKEEMRLEFRNVSYEENGVSVLLSQKRVAQFRKRLNEYIHNSGE